MKPQFHLPLSTYPDPSSFTTADNAVDLALQCNADLLASIPQVKISSVCQSFPTAVDVDLLRAQAERYSHDCGKSLRDHIGEVAPKAGVALNVHDFRALEPFVCDAFVQIARTQDLSILEACDVTRSLSEALLFDSGRPIILCPTSHVCGRVDNIAIAWDGSVTAARAIAGGRLFFDRASTVQVITVTDDKEIDEKTRALFLSTLARTGLKVDDVAIRAGEQSAALAIQSAALERNADLLVAGGFGHSRLREFILGGVTRELLGGCDLPVLMAH